MMRQIATSKRLSEIPRNSFIVSSRILSRLKGLRHSPTLQVLGACAMYHRGLLLWTSDDKPAPSTFELTIHAFLAKERPNVRCRCIDVSIRNVAILSRTFPNLHSKDEVIR